MDNISETIKANSRTLIVLGVVVALIVLLLLCGGKSPRRAADLQPQQSLAVSAAPKPAGAAAPPGSECASLPPSAQESCRVSKLNALASGQCNQLKGCDAAVCQDLFKNGVYPRPMAYANVPPERRLVPPSFSKDYPDGYFAQLSSPLWGTECQVEPVGFYQGDLAELAPGYVNVEAGALPKFNPFLKPGMPSEPYKTQWPIAQDQGFVGLHDWGMQIGNYNFSGQ